MAKNIGTVDKLIRLVIVAIIAILYATKTITGTAAIIAGIIAILLLLTTLFSYCGLYSLLKVSTRKKEKTG